MKRYCGLVFLAALCSYGHSAVEYKDPFSDLDFQKKLFDSKHSKCLQKYLGNSTFVADEFNDALMVDELPRFMMKHCPQWRKAIECYDAHTEELQPHLNLVQKVVVSTFRKMIISSLDYLCADNGKRLIEFMNRDGMECFDSNLETLKTCFDPLSANKELLNTAVNTFNAQDDQDAPAVTWSPTMFSGQECRLINNATECVLQTIKQSCSNYSHTFVHDFLIGLLKQSPCGSFVGMMDFIEWEHYILTALVPKHIPRNDRICKNNATGFALAQHGLVNASKCWNEIIDKNFLVEDFTNAFSSGTYVSFLKKYCPKLIGLTGCVGDYLDLFQQCVEEEGEDAKTLESHVEVVKVMGTFLCHGNGERILQFLGENGIGCLESQQKNIVKCIEDAGVTELFQGDGIQDLLDFINNLWVPQNYRPRECKVIVSLEVCVYKNMYTCEKRRPAHLISSLIRAVARRSPCWDVEGGASKVFGLGSSYLTVILLVMLSFFLKKN